MNKAKKSVIWAPEARDQLRAIDRSTAMSILHAVDDHLTTGAGDVEETPAPA